MSASNDLNAMEILDEIENLLFLCDRLNNRLIQVTSYVDEVKKTWVGKRRSLELDFNVSPIIAQKAIKCNKVLLNVAEKLAVVELQTESLHNLHSLVTNGLTTNNEKPAPAAAAVISQLAISKAEPLVNGLRSQRDMIPTPTRLLPNGTTSFTTRNAPTLFSETVSVKTPTEQQQQQLQQSAFRRPLPVQDNVGLYKAKASPSIPQTPQNQLPARILSNGPSFIHPTDSYLSGKANELNGTDNKIRVKMQVVPSGTIWRNADIPIVDHPSAFFVSNQDPRVAEQFNMMSIEMNNYYSKPANTTTPLQNISIGDFCVARFSDDHLWYRARVVLNNNESVLIVFIDYGNSESKPPNEIYPLIESLARLPAMTVACTLNEAFPSNENFWTQEATDAFNVMAKNRIVEVHFQQAVDQQWPLHFVKILVDGQSVTQHPKLAPHITLTRNEQIASHFNDKLTPMEYILYNVAVVEADVYNNSLP